MDREIDHRVLEIQDNALLADAFIQENEAFIRSCHRHWQNRTSASEHLQHNFSESEDAWSIALGAFHEALKTYNYEKGSFYSFASMVIERRLIDHARKEKRHLKEVPIDPYVFESGGDQEENYTNKGVRTEVVRHLTMEPDLSLVLEIDAANQQFAHFGFTFYDLAECSPKADKTKAACGKAVRFLLNSPVLLKELQQSKHLPIKTIENMTGVPRKILDRHRKYIIAATEIVGGDYPYLSQYMRFIREETSR